MISNEGFTVDVTQDLHNNVLSTLREELQKHSQFKSHVLIQVWDESKLLIDWAHHCIPFSKHQANPKTIFNNSTGKLENAGSPFTVSYRVSRFQRDTNLNTMYCGTHLGLRKIEHFISGYGKSEFLIIPNSEMKSLRYWIKKW